MSRFIENDTYKVINNILKHYYSRVQGDYIPAIVNEGALFGNDKLVNDDLYIKLIAVKKGTKITRTWFLHNLYPYKEEECFNFIVEYNYLRKKRYGIHPDLLCDSSISICEQESDEIMDLEFLDSNHKINGDRVLKMNNDELLILFPFIKDYSDKVEHSFEHKYDLFVEVEYRTFNDNLVPNKLGQFEFADGVVDLSYEKNDAASKFEKQKLYWLRATIKLDTKQIVPNNKVKNDLGVVDLETRKIRNLNPNNFDDDMHAGLIVFSNEAVDMIKKYYYFYDLYLIPKKEDIKSCLIDVLDDCVVFWEGEFNSNLPYELKEQIKCFNLKNVTEHLLSDAMYRSQLMAQWDIFKYLLPNQKLGRLMLRNYKEKSFESGIDFYPPRNTLEYSVFVEKMFSITGLRLEKLNISTTNKEKLGRIIKQTEFFETYRDLYNNYQGLCLLFIRELGFSDEKE